MSGEDEAERATRGGVVVVLRGEPRQGGAELLGEGGAPLGAGEAHLRLEGDRRQRLLRALGAARELGEVAQEPRGRGDLVAGGEAVLDRGRVGTEGAEQARVDHEGARRDAHGALDAATALALLLELDETRALELAQVVVQPLAREGEAPRQSGGRVGGVLELAQEPAAERREQAPDAARVVEDPDGAGGGGRGGASDHGGMFYWTRRFVYMIPAGIQVETEQRAIRLSRRRHRARHSWHARPGWLCTVTRPERAAGASRARLAPCSSRSSRSRSRRRSPSTSIVPGSRPRPRRAGCPDSRRRSCATARSDRKSTRLNSSHSQISYAVFCLKKKKRGKNLDVRYEK